MEKGMSEKGIEADETREPKIKAMKRAIELLRNNRYDNYIERAEGELGKLVFHDFYVDESGKLVDNDTLDEKQHNRKVFQRAQEIEDKEWKELWEIFKGTRNSKRYSKKYDGTDMRAWWD